MIETTHYLPSRRLQSFRSAGLPTILAVVAALAVSAAAQKLPTGFSNQTLATGLNQPAGLAFLPDGRTLIVEQRTAAVKVFAGGLVGTVGVVPNVNASGNERGLLGIAVDPGWPARPYIYCYYSHTASSSNNMRLSRFAVSGSLTAPASTNLTLGAEYAILTDIPDQASNHNGGTCRFGPDGMIYISVGDDANSCAAQSMSDLRGVILRLDVSRLPTLGAGPPAKSLLVPGGNPFTGPNDNARITWSYGLRNPFRFNIDPLSGNLYIADVGQRAIEEMDESITGGENFGWPWREGLSTYSNCGGAEPASVAPIGFYDRTSLNSASIISFTRYRNRPGGVFNFGNAYEGDVFFAEYYESFVRRISWDGKQWQAAASAPGQPTASNWATDIFYCGDAILGPDGAIYWLSQFPGALHRVIHQPKLPLVVASATAQAGKPFSVRAQRNAGDLMLIALNTFRIPATPIAGFFGRLEIVPNPLASGTADGSGSFGITLGNVPAAAVGLTVHFQALAVAGVENYLSSVVTVKVTS